MCLAVPMRLESAEGDAGIVEVDGVRRTVRLDLLRGVRPGDWVLIHAGVAIQVLDESAATETLELLRALAAAGESDGGDFAHGEATPSGPSI